MIVAVALMATACGTSDGTSDTTIDDGVTRLAGDDLDAPTTIVGSIFIDVISGAYEAYGELLDCLDNQRIGQPCEASTADNIRSTLQEVRDLRATIDRNQQQALAEFDSIRQLIRNQNIQSLAAQLRPMVVNVGLATKAYEALAECAVSTTGTCRPFIGRDGDAPIDVAAAISKTTGYLLEKIGNLPVDLPVTASWFTGTGPIFDDGLAEAIWVYNKGQQDIAAGVTSTDVKNGRTVRVLTPDLADATNNDLAYWANVYGQYAFLMVLQAGLSGGDQVAERRQAEADSRIGSTTTRESVSGTTAYYGLPTLPSTGVVLADGGRAWLITPATGAGRPLEPNDLLDLRRIVGTYTSWDAFVKVPRALPPDQSYVVSTPVDTVRYPDLSLWTNNFSSPIATYPNIEIAWLADASTATNRCPSRVRPTTNPPPRDPQALYIPPRNQFAWNEFFTTPEFSPRDRLTTTWYTVADGKPIEYTWDTRTISLNWTPKTYLGWGAWILCTDIRPGSYVELTSVPGVMRNGS